MIIPRFETRKSQRFEDANYRKTRKSHGKNTLVSSRFSLKNNTLKKTLQKQVVAEELVVCNGGLPLGVGIDLSGCSGQARPISLLKMGRWR